MFDPNASQKRTKRPKSVRLRTNAFIFAPKTRHPSTNNITKPFADNNNNPSGTSMRRVSCVGVMYQCHVVFMQAFPGIKRIRPFRHLRRELSR